MDIPAPLGRGVATSNGSERSLRPAVLKRKIFGSTRSRRGDDFIVRGHSVVEPCRRQGRDALNYMPCTKPPPPGSTRPAPSLVSSTVPSG